MLTMMTMRMMSPPRRLLPRKLRLSPPPRRTRRRLSPPSPRLLRPRRKPPRRRLPRKLRNEHQMIDSHLYRNQISYPFFPFLFPPSVSLERFAEFNKIYKLSHFEYRKHKPPYYISWNQSMQSLLETQTQDPPREFFNMFQNEKSDSLFLRSISKELDQYFGGGLHKGMITQVYGESGSGKSQLAMLFALGAVSRNIPCCYLSTEKEMSWNRYTSIAYKYMNEAQFQQTEKALMYKKSSDFNQGYPFIEECLKRMKQAGKGGLLVIDSVHCFIMSCLQFHNIENDAFQKSRKQAQIVNRLRWIAKMAGCAVLLINHAADLMDKRRSSLGRTVVASLGPSWQLNVDQNIYMSRKGQIRSLSFIHSPKCPTNKKMRFRIENDGFVWISQDGVEYVE